MRDTIANALKDALKAKDACRVSTLRLIQAKLKDCDIANRGVGKGPVENDELLQILAKMIKQREESSKIFAENGRPELAEKELTEIAVLERFLPAAMSAEEIEALTKTAIAETGATGKADMGKVMKLLQERTAGRADGKTLSQTVSRLLA